MMLEQGSGISGTFKGIQYMAVNFGRYMNGNIYFHESALNSSKPLPAVVWLHPYSYQVFFRLERPFMSISVVLRKTIQEMYLEFTMP